MGLEVGVDTGGSTGWGGGGEVYFITYLYVDVFVAVIHQRAQFDSSTAAGIKCRH